MRLGGGDCSRETGDGQVNRRGIDGQSAEAWKAQLASQGDGGCAYVNCAVGHIDRCRWTCRGRVVIKDNTG